MAEKRRRWPGQRTPAAIRPATLLRKAPIADCRLADMAKPPARSTASLLVECLAAERCDYVFSVPGEETMDILDALSRQDAVRHITTRHEQCAAFMADVYGRLTGRAAVAMATLGPGATNLVPGSPMVALTGRRWSR